MADAALLLAGRYRLAQPPEPGDNPQLLSARDEHLDRPVTIIWPLPAAAELPDRPSLNAAWQPTVYDRGSWSEHEFLVSEPLEADACLRFLHQHQRGWRID